MNILLCERKIMTREEAILFLKNNQPLPSDDKLSQEQIDIFDNIRKYLSLNPDPIFIPLVLNAFGNGSGFGVYQLYDNFFRNFEHSKLVSHLIEAFKNENWGVRYWATQWAMECPDIELILPLSKMLRPSRRLPLLCYGIIGVYLA